MPPLPGAGDAGNAPRLDCLDHLYPREDLDDTRAIRALLEHAHSLPGCVTAWYLCGAGPTWPNRDRFLDGHPLPEALESGLIRMAERVGTAGGLHLAPEDLGPAHPELPARLRMRGATHVVLHALPAWAPRPAWLLLGLDGARELRDLPGLGTALAALLWAAEARQVLREERRHHLEKDDRLIVQGFEMARIREQAEREEETARRRVEEAERAKNEFLSSVSHELRTPLNAIQGYTRMVLRESNLTDRQRLSLERVMSSSQNQLRLINNILDYSRLEAGRMRVELEELDVVQVLRDVLVQVEPLVSEQGLELHFQPEPDLLGLRTVSDRAKLEQVLINLLGNAIKFTAKGSITLGVRQQSGTLLLSVTDTGIGVAQAEQEQIFERFRRSSQTEGARSASGTGLGLAISRRLGELLGGRLTLESEPGYGSTFTLTLPHFVDQETARLALGQPGET